MAGFGRYFHNLFARLKGIPRFYLEMSEGYFVVREYDKETHRIPVSTVTGVKFWEQDRFTWTEMSCRIEFNDGHILLWESDDGFDAAVGELIAQKYAADLNEVSNRSFGGEVVEF